jgi:hypothetical protein
LTTPAATCVAMQASQSASACQPIGLPLVAGVSNSGQAEAGLLAQDIGIERASGRCACIAATPSSRWPSAR